MTTTTTSADFSKLSESTHVTLVPWVGLSCCEPDGNPVLRYGIDATLSSPPTLVSWVKSFWDESEAESVLHPMLHRAQLSVAERVVELMKSGQMVFDLDAELDGLTKALEEGKQWIKAQGGSRGTVTIIRPDKYTNALLARKETGAEYMRCTESQTHPLSLRIKKSGFRIKKSFPSGIEDGPSHLHATLSPMIAERGTSHPSASISARFVWKAAEPGPDGQVHITEPHSTECADGRRLSSQLRDTATKASSAAWEAAERNAQSSGLLDGFDGHFDLQQFSDALLKQHKAVIKVPTESDK